MKKIIIFAVAFLIVSPGLFAQWKAGKQDTTQHTVLYSCPKHSNVINNNSEKCPCEMNLNLSKKEQMKAQLTKTYTCPVNADIISGKPSNLSLTEQMKWEVAKLNNHAVNANIARNKTDKCPGCSMALAGDK